MAVAKKPTGAKRKRRKPKAVRQSEVLARDLAIFHRRVAWKWPKQAVAAEAGVSTTTVDNVVKRMSGKIGLLDTDPVQIIEWLLREHEADLLLYTVMAGEAAQDSVRIAAVNGREQTLVRVRDLLQATGKLTRNLGTMRHLIDFRALVDVVVDELTAAGQMEVAERIVEVLRERGMAGLLERGDG